MQKPKCFVALFISLTLFACGGGGSSASGSIPPPTPVSSTNVISLGNLTTIPINNNQATTAIVLLNNSDLPLKYYNSTVNINNTLLTVNNGNSYVNPQSCLSIESHSSCQININTNSTPGNFLLTVVYNSANGQSFSSNQVITYANNIPDFNGFSYAANNTVLIKAIGKATAISIPFILTTDYSSIGVTSSNPNFTTTFSCNNNKFTNGTMCTAFVEIDGNITPPGETSILTISGITLVSAKQKANSDPHIKAAPVVLDSNLQLTVSQNTVGHLITSGTNTLISPADGSSPQTVYLVNNGQAAVTNILVNESIESAVTPLIASANNCPSSLAAGASCSFQLNVNLSITNGTSGQTPVEISYYDSSANQIMLFNAVYIGAIPVPLLTYSVFGNLTSTSLNTANQLWILVSNSGNVNFTNLNFSVLPSDMSYGGSGQTCITGQSLAIGQTCNLIVQYFPIAVESATLTLYPTANFINSQSGNSNSYVLSSVATLYSSLNPALQNFIAVGDLGLIMEAPVSNPVSTWTTSESPPFGSTSSLTAIGRIPGGNLVLGGTFISAASPGIYTSNQGVLWNTAATNNSLTTQSLALGPTNLFLSVSSGTAGQKESAFWTAESTLGAGSTWTQVTALTAGATNRVFYLNNGTNSIYLIGGTTTFAVSTTGTSGWAVQGVCNTSGVTSAIYDSAAFYVLGGAGTVCKSTNGSTGWAAQTTITGTPAIVSAVHLVESGATPNCYLAASGTAAVYYSTTNPTTTATWTATTVTGSSATKKFMAVDPNTNAVLTAAGTSIESITVNASTCLPTLNGTVAAAQPAVAGNLTLGNINNIYYDATESAFIATSTAGEIITSYNDGLTWSTNKLTNIVNNAGTYIATGSNGLIAESTNLGNLLPQTTPVTTQLNSDACIPTSSGTSCAAVGNSGTIIFESNAGAWVTESSGTTQNLNSLVCGAICVAVGNLGTILTSPDLQNWSAATSPTTNNLNDVAYFVNNGSPTFVAVGNSAVVLQSANGTNWTLLNNTSIPSVNNLSSVACSNSSSIFTCVTSAGPTEITFFTQDVATWTASTFSLLNNPSLNSIALNGAYSIVVGNTVTSGSAGIIYYTTNRAAWAIANTLAGFNLNFSNVVTSN